MKKIVDKIALVAVIILGFIAIVLAIIFPMLATGWVLGTNDILFMTIAVLYVGVSIYLLWSVFSSDGNVRTLTLFSDKESTTKTSLRVIKSLVVSDSKRVKGAAVKRVRVSQRDNGIKLSITLTVVGAEVEETVDTMRCLVADTFIKVLGVRFDYIDFKIEKVRPNYVADEATARKRAQILKNERKCSDKYHDEAMDPIFEQAEKERDKAEEQMAEEVTAQKKARQQGAPTKENETSQENYGQEGGGQEEQNPRENEQTYGNWQANYEQKQGGEDNGNNYFPNSRAQRRAKNKRDKRRAIPSPSLDGGEKSPFYLSDAEKVTPRELEERQGENKADTPHKPKVIDSDDFTISDGEED